MEYVQQFYCDRMWLEGMLGAGNTNATCCGGPKLTCGHNVVFPANAAHAAHVA